MPQFILFLRDRGEMPPDFPPAELERIIKRYVDWRAKVARAGHRITGHKLKDGEGRTLRGKAGAPGVTDGPYAETKEILGGIYILEAADYDEAQRLASDCPHLAFGSVEIRQVEPIGD